MRSRRPLTGEDAQARLIHEIPVLERPASRGTLRMLPDDRKLVRLCLDGQPEAFGGLYDLHGARVYGLLRRLTGNDAAAQDLLQETFLAAYRSLGEWRGEAALGTWLCGIAFRLYRSTARKEARHPSEALEEQEELPALEGDPLRHLARRELQERLDAAIGELPPEYRDVFVMVKVEGLSYREAAGWLGVPLGTVQSRLWRAVCRLQGLLADLEPGTAGEDRRKGACPPFAPIPSDRERLPSSNGPQGPSLRPMPVDPLDIPDSSVRPPEPIADPADLSRPRPSSRPSTSAAAAQPKEILP
jgi:RNA polymerase sigma-70 factor (ECF subfamily)